MIQKKENDFMLIIGNRNQFLQGKKKTNLFDPILTTIKQYWKRIGEKLKMVKIHNSLGINEVSV